MPENMSSAPAAIIGPASHHRNAQTDTPRMGNGAEVSTQSTRLIEKLGLAKWREMLCDRGRRNEAGTLAGGEGGREGGPPLPAPLPALLRPPGREEGSERCRFHLPELPLTFRSSGKAKPEAAAVSATVRFFIHLRPEEEGEGEGIFGKAWHARKHAAPPPAHVTREGVGGGGTMLLLLRQNK